MEDHPQFEGIDIVKYHFRSTNAAHLRHNLAGAFSSLFCTTYEGKYWYWLQNDLAHKPTWMLKLLSYSSDVQFWPLDIFDNLPRRSPDEVSYGDSSWSPATTYTDPPFFEHTLIHGTEGACHQPRDEYASVALPPSQEPKHTPPSAGGSTSAASPSTISFVGLIGLPPGELSPSSGRRKFKCAMPNCRRYFDRRSRAEGCYYKHHNRRPHHCRGKCGNRTWWAICIPYFFGCLLLGLTLAMLRMRPMKSWFAIFALWASVPQPVLTGALILLLKGFFFR